MTQNQIRYLEAQEAQRANLAKEAENIRTNMAREKETNRSNLENERLNREKLEFEKYGKDFIGSAIRTGKAVGSDIVNGASAIGEAIATPIRQIAGISAPSEAEMQAQKGDTNRYANMDNSMLMAYADEVRSGKKSWRSDADKEIFRAALRSRGLTPEQINRIMRGI